MKIRKFILNYDGYLNISKEEINSEFIRAFNYFKENKRSTQVLTKYFLFYMETNTWYDLIDRSKKLQDLGNGYSLERCVLSYGKEIGTIKWNKYCERQSYTNSKEYKNMTDDEFDKYNKSRAVTLDNLILKYGKDEGIKKFEKYCERQSYTNSIDYFIKKYGYAKGKEKYARVNFLKSNSLDSYISKFGEAGKKKYTDMCEKRQLNFYSHLASNLFSNIEKHVKIESKIYYAPKTKEFGKLNEKLRKYTYFDFVIPDLKLCIEFNGDVFHANPKIFKETDTPNPYNNLTSKEIWEHDQIKNNELIKLGYDVLIVWESDYNNDKSVTEQNLINFIKDRYDKYTNYRV